MNAPVTVIGNLTSDPDLKYFASGTPKLSFGIASDRGYYKDEEWVSETSFFNVIAWRKLAEQAADVLAKGTKVIVSGRLEQRSWETTDGDKRSTVEIVADDIAVHVFAMSGFEKRQYAGAAASNGGSRAPKAVDPDVAPW